jgi:hypothetical protein
MRRQAVRVLKLAHEEVEVPGPDIRVLKLAHEEVEVPGPDIDEQPLMGGHPGRSPKHAASAIDRQTVREIGR